MALRSSVLWARSKRSSALGQLWQALRMALRVAVENLGADHQCCDLLLLDYFPVNELFDVRMVKIEHHHLGGPAGSAARLDGAGGAVADFEEAHQAAGLAAAREGLALTAKKREIGSGATAVFKDACLAHPQIHDAAFVYQIVAHRLDEAGVRGDMLIGRRGPRHLCRHRVHIIMTLRRSFNAISPMQTGIEPLRTVGRRHLRGQHPAAFVEKGLSVLLCRKIAALPAPVSPATRQAAEYLASVGFLAGALFARRGLAALQPLRHVGLGNALQPRAYAGFAEVFLRQDIDGHLRPVFWRMQILHLEHRGAVRIDDP